MAKDSPDPAAATQLDVNMAPHRLKEGLVPEDTLVCLRVEEGVGAGTAIGPCPSPHATGRFKRISHAGEHGKAVT